MIVMDQDGYGGGGVKWSGCGYILKAEWTVFPHRVAVESDGKRLQRWLLCCDRGTGKMALPFSEMRRLWVEEVWSKRAYLFNFTNHYYPVNLIKKRRAGMQFRKHGLRRLIKDIDVEMAGRTSGVGSWKEVQPDDVQIWESSAPRWCLKPWDRQACMRKNR